MKQHITNIESSIKKITEELDAFSKNPTKESAQVLDLLGIEIYTQTSALHREMLIN
jgi:hypothetical protein